ncbi:Ku protein [Streptomyces sp. NRRL F-5630]|uniref:non-homologous end joining protein Ku n=1 Tax=unclassified Streptomyces TaxID=2593676 RepID=UPI0004CAB273|nr:Ku protein [Streptomyces sp. NRRL F-5630]
MRSIWNGAVSFGLVSIPVKLVNATENHTVSFRQIHTEDGGRVRYRKVCELEDKEIPGDEIGKAYEDADGSLIPITDEDLASLPLPTTKTIDIVAFVPADSIDPLQMDAAYYLASGGSNAAKPYTLLREALKRGNRVALAKFALRGKERLGMLRVVGDVLVLHGLHWPDEIRAPEGVAPTEDVKVRDKELDLAESLMDTLGEVDVNDLHDDYRQAVEEMIAAKTEGHELPAPERPAGGGKVIDLMAALENSVKAAQKSRGADPSEEEVAEVHQLEDRKKKAAPKKKTASAKKTTPAKKSAPAKKTAAKKTAPKKKTPPSRKKAS